MTQQSRQDPDDMPDAIDFSKGVRGLHTIPATAKVFVPASVEREVLEYFANQASEKGVSLPELLTEVLKREMDLDESAG